MITTASPPTLLAGILARMKEFLQPMLPALISLFGALFTIGLTIWVIANIIWAGALMLGLSAICLMLCIWLFIAGFQRARREDTDKDIMV